METIKYIIVASQKYDTCLTETSSQCEADLNKEHKSLQVNRKYLKNLSGEGNLYTDDYRLSYIYSASSAFRAGSGRYLEYVFQYAGYDGFKSILFDLVDQNSKILYRIFEVSRFGSTKRFRIHVPFDSDIDPTETRIIIQKVYAQKSLPELIL